MTELEALRMLSEILMCAGIDVEEGRKMVDFFTKEEEGHKRLKERYEELVLSREV